MQTRPIESPTLIRPRDVRFRLHFNDPAELIPHFNEGRIAAYRVVLPDGVTIDLRGFVTSIDPGGGRVNLRMTSAPQFDLTNKKETPVKRKYERLFYVGHPKIATQKDGGWAKATLGEALAHAKSLCEKTGQDQVVVQIVRVVRQTQPPIAVEVVRGPKA